ncbi:hypothetical protein QCA50_008261 [Cerrena zonata]|uniref:Membrane insertase YidC/Oxa/ALB C-terminal domain-containing protein n=1 Tax=Cerrena zonata TaxID=2478898 RepID=A0AAW0G5Z8_9APHY
MLASVSCSRASGTALGCRIPRVAFSSRSRLLSTTALQRTRLSSTQKDVRLLPSSSRHFWWSSSSPKTPVEASPISSQLLPPTELLADPTASTEQPPIESISTADASPSTLSESVSLTTDLASSADVVSAAASNVPYIPPAMQYGELALLGLTSYTPAGLSRWTMEILHISCSLPWGPTILATTVLTRLILLPFSVSQLRNTARMAPHQEEILALREELNQARGNSMAIQRAMLKQKALNEKMGVNMLGMIVMPFVQLPVTLGMFFGVKGLCDSGIEALKWSGWAWLPDLTIADPTGALPVLVTVAMNFQLSLGLKDMAPNPNTPHIINLFRALSIGGLAFMFNLPAGVQVYLLTSILSMTAQTALLRLPAVRRALNIPVLPPTSGMKSASFGESIKYVRTWWNDQKKEAVRKAKADRRRSL